MAEKLKNFVAGTILGTVPAFMMMAVAVTASEVIITWEKHEIACIEK